MDKTVVAAIVGAVNAYLEQEAQAKAVAPRVMLYPEISPWRLFGRQELMRARVRWQVKRTSK